ncbi:MAG: Pyruvate kinase [Myxococcaceae bacterium]|nr:Pyruvate kinase [Myxococcaceae bacterium]
MRRAKILATVGPASRDSSVLDALIAAGVDGFRVNFSHGVPDDHRSAVRSIRAAAARAGRNVAILGDLSGPKIRCRTFAHGPVELVDGATFTLTTRAVPGDVDSVSMTYPLWKDLRVGDPVLLDDGLLRLRVTGIHDEDVVCVVEVGGPLSDRKGINVPGAKLTVPALTEKDREDALLARELGVDYLALSFVRHPSDLVEARLAVGEGIPLIAKIEKPEAIENLEAIILACEGIMVARGDLGVELGPEKVPLAQKRAILLANAHGKLVVTATQMLDSMIRSPRPTRAEAADVANAVLDTTDVLMLSGETASGRYPVVAVQMMDTIVREIETSPLYEKVTEPLMARMDWDFTHACAAAASLTSRHAKLAAIVVFTRAGHTADMVAEFRPRSPIIAVTATREVAQRLALQWGVLPVVHTLPDAPNETLTLAARIARESLQVRDGDTIGIVSGHQKDTGTKSFVLHTLQAT